MIGFLPYRTPNWITETFPGLIWKGESEDLYLTFDDGPIPNVTEYIIELLEEYSIKATFFCVGDNIRKHPEVFSMLIDGGHMIGNHTFNHLNGWQSNDRTYLENIAMCQDCLDSTAIPKKGRLFRPPHGRITISQFQKLQHLYKVVMWTVLTQDFNSGHSMEYSLKKSIKATTPGSIIVFHDNIKAEKKTRYMLRRYIDHFLNRGFQFKLL